MSGTLWVYGRFISINSLMMVERLMEVSLVPPLLIYPVVAFTLAVSWYWLRVDFKLLSGVKRFRALIVPLLLMAIMWLLKQPIQGKYDAPAQESTASRWTETLPHVENTG